MTVARTKGAKAKADKLFSKIIRRSGACENCDYRCPPECDAWAGSHRVGCKLQCAHLISRHLSATRCNLRNAFALCAKCHYHFTNWPIEFTDFVFDKRSREEYSALRASAQQGGSHIDWSKELERLEYEWASAGQSWDF